MASIELVAGPHGRSEFAADLSGAFGMKLPIDTTGMTILAASAAEPVIDFETKRPRTDLETGAPIVAMQLVLLAGEAAEVISVKLTGTPPVLAVGSPVRVERLVATPWSMGERSGISFRATSVSAAAAPPAAAPAPVGRAAGAER